MVGTHGISRKLTLTALAAVAALVWSIAPASGLADDAPTYYKDVMPIFQQNCQSCHREGQIGPMPLENYHQSRPWAKSIRDVVQEGSMPPWHADAEYGDFKNEMRLSPDEVETIVAWASTGARAGQISDAPKAVEFTDDWQIGTPDQIFTMAEPYTLGPEGDDEYKYFVVPTGLTEDKWVTAIEVKAGNAAIVHHVIAFIQNGDAPVPDEGGIVPVNSYRPESPEQLEKVIARQAVVQEKIKASGLKEKPIRVMGMLGGMAPGTPPFVCAEGEGKLLPAGSKLIFQMHYNRNGETEVDQTSIGVKYADRPMDVERLTVGVFNVSFAIPPGESDYRVDSWHTFNEDVRVHMFMPHMHLRGVGFEYEAIYPDGRRETLLSIPEYDFNWQFVYELDEAITLPKGTTVHCVGTFDNSTGNPDNPDPDAIVRFGEPTIDEMMIGWMDVSRVNAEDKSKIITGRDERDSALATF